MVDLIKTLKIHRIIENHFQMSAKSAFGSANFNIKDDPLHNECSFDKGNRLGQGNKQVSFRAAVCQMN